MFCMARELWLGLGRNPEDRPLVEEGEREGAALLVGVVEGLLEVEQLGAASCWWERGLRVVGDQERKYVGFYWFHHTSK